jgi:three-Cys-motif partner protein
LTTISSSKRRAKSNSTAYVNSDGFSNLFPRCQFQEGDANVALEKWCQERDWRKERAVVFLDPFGMQVDWKTVVALGQTKGVDLWYLFPLSGVVRMLTRDGIIDETWQRRLDTTLGTEDWRTRFYEVRKARCSQN